MPETEEVWISPRKRQHDANREAFELFLAQREIEQGFCWRCGRPNCDEHRREDA